MSIAKKSRIFMVREYQQVKFRFQLKLSNNGVIQTLANAYEALGGDPPSKTPFLIWLLENPASPLPFPGKIDLYRHDCLHILLERSFSLYDEAFIVGFTMGNDPDSNHFHIALFKLISSVFYPKDYQFNSNHLRIFDLGLIYGNKINTKNIKDFDFQLYQHKTITEIRRELGIDLYTIQVLRRTQNLLTQP
ncbi:MAG: hypothetical protein V7K21_29940 [Nostoc sp.]|uniref:hypothetical protein n=1 Tax=Nostoc sp. TaxID=1180 RepID=UPI002FF53D40